MSEYDPFAPIYDQWSEHMTEDVPFYVDLAREADGPIAELAVGTGRVAIPVARETGKRVVGIDLSPAMLAIARERAAEAGVDLDLRLQDMRDFELEEPAALVYSPVPVTAAHADMGRQAPRLRPRRREPAAGGQVRLERVRLRPCDREPTPWAAPGGAGSAHESRRRLTRAASTSSSTPAPAVSLWWATKNEWLGLIEVAGLEVEALYGDFERGPFDEDSREFVWVARKPG